MKAVIPTNDYVFKRIFGQVGNENITKDFLNSILEEEIESVDLDGNTILERDLADDKMGILDIKAKLDDDIICNIEMQMIHHKNIDKRLMYYWSKIYVAGIKSGQNYNSLKKTIAILIANFEIDALEGVSKMHTEWKLREREFSQIVLTEVCEIHIIELPKLKRIVEREDLSSKENKLRNWIKFLLTPNEMEGIDMDKNENIKKAKEEFEHIQKDEYEIRMAELRMKHIMDSKAIEEYGYDKGVQVGIEQGEKDTKIKIAKKMLENNVNIELIIECTGLKREEIERLSYRKEK